MVQLRILSGSQAGGFQTIRRFPFHVGRAADNDLALEVPGVWNYHFMLDLRPGKGIIVQTFDQAYVAVNEEQRTFARLHNGDTLSFGSAKVQFWLAGPVQRSLRWREFFVWALLALVTLAQLGLVYFLLQAK